jgi:hypothetical protein
VADKERRKQQRLGELLFHNDMSLINKGSPDKNSNTIINCIQRLYTIKFSLFCKVGYTGAQLIHIGYQMVIRIGQSDTRSPDYGALVDSA